MAYGAPGVWLKRPSSSNSFAVNFPLAGAIPALSLSLIHISEPTRHLRISTSLFVGSVRCV
ncbi:hypothetical protein ACX3V1_25870 [Escherichia coli]